MAPDGDNGVDVVSAGERVVQEPADRALGYGERAIGHGTRVAAAPAKKTGDHVRAAKREWERLRPFLPAGAASQSIVFFDLATYPVEAIARFGYDAWTRSATKIYVGRVANSSRARLRAVLYHESLHVEQFLAENGEPPPTYALMVRYECDAYRESAAWLRKPTDKQKADTRWSKVQRGAANSFCAKIGNLDAKAARAVTQQDDQAYRKFMVDNGYLPKEAPKIPKELFP
jgi:hypothetical protein